MTQLYFTSLRSESKSLKSSRATPSERSIQSLAVIFIYGRDIIF